MGLAGRPAPIPPRKRSIAIARRVAFCRITPLRWSIGNRIITCCRGREAPRNQWMPIRRPVRFYKGGRKMEILKKSLLGIALFLLFTEAYACGNCQCIREQIGENRVERIVLAERLVEQEAQCVQGCKDIFGGTLGGANSYDYQPRNASECTDCGQHWSDWVEVGGGVGNPCPAGCTRQEEVGQDHRLVGLTPRPQTKHKFQCRGIQTPPPPPPPAQPPAPTRQDCGEHWTGWIEVGGGVGSPCPTGCSRGREVGQSHRFVGIPSRPQTKHKFQCWRP